MFLLVSGVPKDIGGQEPVRFVVPKQYHQIYVHIYIYIYTYIYIYPHIHKLHIHIYIYMDIHKYTHIQTHTHTYIYINILKRISIGYSGDAYFFQCGMRLVMWVER